MCLGLRSASPYLSIPTPESRNGLSPPHSPVVRAYPPLLSQVSLTMEAPPMAPPMAFGPMFLGDEPPMEEPMEPLSPVMMSCRAEGRRVSGGSGGAWKLAYGTLS